MKNYEKIRLSEAMKVFERELEDFTERGLSDTQDNTQATDSALRLALAENEKDERFRFLVKAHTYISSVVNVYQDLYLKAKELDNEIIERITTEL